MLTTRPTLLYLAGKIIRGHGNREKTTEPLHKFAKSCIDAAQRSLNILQALQQQQLLANFGFFNLDAIFSVAFVFVLSSTIYPDKESCWRDINSTLELLDYLSSHGNKASHNRRADIVQRCDYLGISGQRTRAAGQENSALGEEIERSAMPGSRIETQKGIGHPSRTTRYPLISLSPLCSG
ncbi:fungal specific transcription factor domain-containing protein [Aspergillus undulatus]|uniref:fungal specific transcription factor domain-containing protein n=1 Tax=Aspergillus undulatus TaxID=1810928 RepID=UPI003CCE30E6